MEIFIAEMMGTAVMVFIGSGITAGVLARQNENTESGRLTIALGWGLGYIVAIYSVLGLSKTCFNPALTIGFYMMDPKKYDLVQYLSGQMVGAFIGTALVAINFFPLWSQGKASERKLKKNEIADNQLRSLCSYPFQRLPFFNFFSEMLAVVVFVIATAGALISLGDSDVENLIPLFYGISLSLVILFLRGTTGGTANPAVDLAGRLVHFLLPLEGKRDSDWSYAWIPVVASIVGGAIGGWIYISYILFKYQ